MTRGHAGFCAQQNILYAVGPKNVNGFCEIKQIPSELTRNTYKIYTKYHLRNEAVSVIV